MTFGDRVKARREELGLSQEELATKMNFKSKTSINKIELGKSNITQSQVWKLSQVLNCSINYLFGIEKESANISGL